MREKSPKFPSVAGLVPFMRVCTLLIGCIRSSSAPLRLPDRLLILSFTVRPLQCFSLSLASQPTELIMSPFSCAMLG